MFGRRGPSAYENLDLLMETEFPFGAFISLDFSEFFQSLGQLQIGMRSYVRFSRHWTGTGTGM